MDILEPMVAYITADDNHTLRMIELARQGVNFEAFDSFAARCDFSIREWSEYLHISERTMQRYKSENKAFEPLQSEKILEIALLFYRGIEIFGDDEKFTTWLGMNNIALGNVKPKSLLDSSFGISLLNDELSRISYGVLA